MTEKIKILRLWLVKASGLCPPGGTRGGIGHLPFQIGGSFG